jgi:hypothetical protein
MNKKLKVDLPDIVVKFVLWKWMRPTMPFKYIGVLANSNRTEHKDGKWVIIQDIENGKLYEVLDIDLSEIEK